MSISRNVQNFVLHPFKHVHCWKKRKGTLWKYIIYQCEKGLCCISIQIWTHHQTCHAEKCCRQPSVLLVFSRLFTFSHPTQVLRVNLLHTSGLLEVILLGTCSAQPVSPCTKDHILVLLMGWGPSTAVSSSPSVTARLWRLCWETN